MGRPRVSFKHLTVLPVQRSGEHDRGELAADGGIVKFKNPEATPICWIGWGFFLDRDYQHGCLGPKGDRLSKTSGPHSNPALSYYDYQEVRCYRILCGNFMTNRPKISIVGAGSPTWTRTLAKDILLTPVLQDAELNLFDPDREAAEINAAFLHKLADLLQIGPAIRVSDRKESLEGSDYIIITISTGGLDSMKFDLDIPEQFGIFHTVGDTSGPGGWARLVRNFKPFRVLAETISKLAPSALVLNYTNPMATLTDVLTRSLDNPVIGLCHGLFENLELIRRYFKLGSEKEISINYGGLNHFFWCDKITVRGADVLREFRESGKSMNQVFQESFTDTAGYGSSREVASELFNLTGVLPYLGDRHTCEFFPWYITDLSRMEACHLKRTTIARRQELQNIARSELLDMISGEIPSGYRERSRETAADILEAHQLGGPFIDVGNVANIGQIGNLPLGTIVETAVRVDQNGFSPVCFGNLPEAAAVLVRPYADVYRMTVEACIEGNRAKALQALRADPVCANLTTAKVFEMGDLLLGAHSDWIDCFDLC